MYRRRSPESRQTRTAGLSGFSEMSADIFREESARTLRAQRVELAMFPEMPIDILYEVCKSLFFSHSHWYQVVPRYFLLSIPGIFFTSLGPQRVSMKSSPAGRHGLFGELHWRGRQRENNFHPVLPGSLKWNLQALCMANIAWFAYQFLWPCPIT